MDCRRRIGTGSHCAANSCSNNRHKCPDTSFFRFPREQTRYCTNDCTYSDCFFCNLQFKWPNDFMHFSTLLTCFLTPSLRTNCVYSIIPHHSEYKNCKYLHILLCCMAVRPSLFPSLDYPAAIATRLRPEYLCNRSG